MRTVSINIHNGQRVELFTRKNKNCFELWVVGPRDGRRVVYDHHLTHDNIEARLMYSKIGDLNWVNGRLSDIPTEYHKNALEMEDAVKKGIFIDLEIIGQSVVGHLFSIDLFPINNSQIRKAKTSILGWWTDGKAEMGLLQNSKLIVACSGEESHFLNQYSRIDGLFPDWWNFDSWQLPVLNKKHKCGMRISVIRVDDKELHLSVGNMNQIASIFTRKSELSNSACQLQHS